jgi:hypothetical protein
VGGFEHRQKIQKIMYLPFVVAAEVLFVRETQRGQFFVLLWVEIVGILSIGAIFKRLLIYFFIIRRPFTGIQACQQ